MKIPKQIIDIIAIIAWCITGILIGLLYWWLK